MSTQNYRLLTTALVNAISVNIPQRKGAIWGPTTVIDIQEAKALETIGYAEVTNQKVNVETREADAPPKAVSVTSKPKTKVEEPEPEPEPEPEEEDVLISDEDATKFLAFPADKVIEAINASDREGKADSFDKLYAFEKKGKNRSTVLKALKGE